jgi:hypothetical protein
VAQDAIAMSDTASPQCQPCGRMVVRRPLLRRLREVFVVVVGVGCREVHAAVGGVRQGLGPAEATAAPITTATDPDATVSRAARRCLDWRRLAWAACVLFGPRGACLLLSARNVTTPGR